MTERARRPLIDAALATSFAGAWLAACGGSDPPPATGAGADATVDAVDAVVPTADAARPSDAAPEADVSVDASALCAQLEARAASCGVVFKPKACLFFTCYDKLFGDADSAALATCIVTRPCDKSDDACFAEVSSKYADDPGGKAFQSACLAKRDACREAGAGFLDDYCAGPTYAMLRDRGAYDACVAKPCGEVKACFEAVVAGAGCP